MEANDARPGEGAGAVVLVCSRCNWTGTAAERNGTRGGAALLQAVREHVRTEGVRVQPVACMSGCRRACVVGLMAPGKVGFLFGDLPPERDSAMAVGALAMLYAAAPDGFVARTDRPPRLRAGILARLPPLAWATGDEIAWPAATSLST